VNSPCPVCRAKATQLFQVVDDKTYHRCGRCQCTFLDPALRPDREHEKAEYDRHRNDPDDPGYRRFLAALADPLTIRLRPGSRGLDYGCGPGPALAMMLQEAGFSMAVYDPIYAPDMEALARRYDFITCTETAEHFHHPAAEFDRLVELLEPGGWLGLMTRFQTDDSRFANWHYRRDPTHVVFYREETFRWLATHHGLDVETRPPNVVLLQKRS
jgi:cyclopropane fatty-acyl-phospholipid synthase-like methyltransferase